MSPLLFPSLNHENGDGSRIADCRRKRITPFTSVASSASVKLMSQTLKCQPVMTEVKAEIEGRAVSSIKLSNFGLCSQIFKNTKQQSNCTPQHNVIITAMCYISFYKWLVQHKSTDHQEIKVLSSIEKLVLECFPLSQQPVHTCTLEMISVLIQSILHLLFKS